MLLITLLCLLLQNSPATEPATRPATRPASPVEVESIQLDGPVAGVLATIDLRDTRVSVTIRPVTEEDPDGAGPMVARLDTVRRAAERFDLELAVNASFFAAPAAREIGGRRVAYFVGNPARPVAWLAHAGETLSTPRTPALANWPVLLVEEDGRVSIATRLPELPADTRHAVSGNVQIIDDGQAVPVANEDRHPRTAVAVSEDGQTLWLLVIDGRRAGHSRGMSYAELADLLLARGAWDAINLDGGGSTTMVLKDPATGIFTVANRPSDGSGLLSGLAIERPVVDVLGIDVAE